jgi:hypothetical protein
MGAGILPTTIHNNKLYFLFGKENKYADTPGFADFGGGTDDHESYIQTAIREGSEELTGFLGSDEELGKMLKKRGTYNINNDGNYRMHIFYLKYDEALPYYYNNNQRFLQKRLDPKVIKETKIFEKAEIRWFCIDELNKSKSEFRSYYPPIIDKILSQQNKIYKVIEKCQHPNQYESYASSSSSSEMEYETIEDYSSSTNVASSNYDTISPLSISSSTSKSHKHKSDKKFSDKKTKRAKHKSKSKSNKKSK